MSTESVNRAVYQAVVVLGICFILGSSTARAQLRKPAEDPARLAFVASHQAGVRLGAWLNQGDTPPDSFSLGSGGTYLTDFSDGNFSLEGYLGYRLSKALVLEFSLGLVSRGDVILVEETGGSSIGTMQIYPIMAKLKVYPFGLHTGRLFPYLMAGGGIYYGRHSIQIATGYDAYLRAELGQDSETDFGYQLGGGIDWPVATMVALELNAQYLPVNFSGDLIGVRDYSSLTITVGVKYLFSAQEKKKDKYRPLSRRGR